MASFSALPIEIGDLILEQLPRRALVECCLVCRGILTAIQRKLYRRVEISAQQLTLLVNMSPRLAELVHEFTVADADHQLYNTTSTETLFNDNIATVLQSFKNIEHIRILVTLNPTSDLRFSHFDPIFLCTFPRLKAFVFTGNTRAVWQSSLIKFLGRHPSVLRLQIRFPAVPSLPCYTMIERPPLLTYTRLTRIETPITIFHMLDPYCFAHLIDVRLLDLDGLFEDQSPALANCLNRLADNAPDLRALDVFSLNRRPLILLELIAQNNFADLRSLSITSTYVLEARQMNAAVYATLCSFPQLKVLILGAKPAKEKIKGLGIPKSCLRSCPELRDLRMSGALWNINTEGPTRVSRNARRADKLQNNSTLPGEFP
ncbi:hypothetical protein B0H13DRAFT_1857152 [Mycena leptocephala]|nr:hypothetical protein B0H13DRAFT_1857152 [Mycena leptocephala]